MKTKVGFIGLGAIGMPMARNLLKGFDTLVYDKFAPSVEPLVASGARVADSPAEMARHCDIIEVCVRDDQDVFDVVSGTDGILAGARPDTVVAIHSTVKRPTILQLNELGKRHSVHILDVPITGGVKKAASGDLCYMFGGPAEVLSRCRTAFEQSASHIVHAGEVGSALALKLCNNMIIYASFIALHEARRLADAVGLGKDLIEQVGAYNGAVTPLMKDFMAQREQVLSEQGREALLKNFASLASLGRKDLDSAIDLADSYGLSLHACSEHRDIIEDAILGNY